LKGERRGNQLTLRSFQLPDHCGTAYGDVTGEIEGRSFQGVLTVHLYGEHKSSVLLELER
jgi:hypothetical protein